ncbi:MAG TPA: NAD(P)-dependent glycerol-3-phosphate dehydrogenase [Nitrospirae bacterium]|nr:glycerol-3-phosphate dehydrogenase [NAD(P)+] [bacterium BMS3Abin06]HDH11523.1 NAD(P)-dependent glycerol-3-phosphate dehydrogenase [Nitrospirota bacterium]HDZ03406.1 NAD(P)-dependent glycerol-3-phosphate dehydrogenase [Nitrospirota bacterium]
MSYIAVIGAGSWGTTLANLLAEKGYNVSLWTYEQELADEINRTNINSVYLPGIPLSNNIEATAGLRDAVKKARYILNVVPTQFTRSVFSETAGFIPDDAEIVSASKGIEHGTLLTVSAILKDLTGRRISVLSGPSFAEEVIKKLPTAVTIASEDNDTGLLLQDIFNTDYFRVYTNTDVPGVELGGALKNVMAIASGISDGLGLGASTRAALITRGLAEMIRLGAAMGAREKTFGGLSGLGDLVLTCTGTLSRNYTVGYKLGRGEKLTGILSNMKMVAEGVATSKSAYELSRKHHVEMPIIEQIYKVINKEKKPVDAVKELMARSLKAEY